MAEQVTFPRCRFCKSALQHLFVDLGMQPLCESYIKPEELNQMEPFYPLQVYVCTNCFLVQIEEFVSPKSIFSEYAYYSSYSETWLSHAKEYVAMITSRLGLSSKSLVVEIGSNDGYLLQYFMQKGIPVFGVEPAANVAEVAIRKGIPTLIEFFSLKAANELSARKKLADLIIGNNVLAQVPDLNSFVRGIKVLLKQDGVVTIEFPHLSRLIDGNQLDTIYHEHFSYFSFITVEKIFKNFGLTVFDVEQLNTHGGSLRIFARHTENEFFPLNARVEELRNIEEEEGFADLQKYLIFGEKAKETKRKLLDLLIKLKRNNKSIVGYGAPGKGNTLLNYCGIRTDFLDYTVDRNPYKQGKFLPGTHIPIFNPDKIKETKPDYLLILPWNIKDEIIRQMSYIGGWGGRFIVPIPETNVYEASGTITIQDI